VSDYAEFFALMPGDNSATVPIGQPVLFPQDGPTAGAITRTGPGTFVLPAAGTYQVSFQVSVTEAGQLELELNGQALPDTVVGRATGLTQLVEETLVTAAAGDSLEVVNPPGNNAALTITTIAGGNDPVSASLVIQQIA
jgi:hypothetical protein